MAAPRDDGYPAHLIEHLVLADGTAVCLRPIHADDLAMHAAFVGDLSFQTGYARLLSPRKPQADELWHMTHVDYVHELALIATTPVDGAEREIGVARYVRGDAPDSAHSTDSAEFAIVIADAWQHRGVATLLLKKLIATAREAGVRQLADITLFDNRGMLALARKLGFTTTRDAGSANVTRLRLKLRD